MLDDSLSGELLVVVKNLSDQVAALKFALSRMESCETASANGSPGGRFLLGKANDAPDCPCNGLTREAKPALPDPRFIRRVIRQRQLRDRFFNGELFGDPVWDMLLDLAAATSEFRQVSVTSLCIASRVPPTTALRWIGLMTDHGLLRRVEDPLDRRRAFISLSDQGMNAMARYFESLGSDARVIV